MKKKQTKQQLARFIWSPGDVKISLSAEKQVEGEWTKYGNAKVVKART